MHVAVIPARSGSRRIPGKNFRHLAGRPIIGWVIETLRASGVFDHVVVSTDSPNLAEQARSLGAECPFIRPSELADDYSTTSDVIGHAADWIHAAGWNVSTISCVYPTAALLRAESLTRALNLLQTSDAPFVFGAVESPFPIQRALRMNGAGRVSAIFDTDFSARSQDLENYVFDAGQFYLGRLRSWRERIPILGPETLAILLPRTHAIDVDDEQDWELMRAVFDSARQARQ